MTGNKKVSEWSETAGKLSRMALGKVGFIGELYDARTELFCSRSLFSSAFPKDLIKSQQSSKCEIEYSYKDQLSDRFNLLKVEAELQLSILLGLFKLQGHGKYLIEEKQSERTASCCLFYNLSTVCEKLMSSFPEIEEYIDKDVFYDEQYTHVVVEINWGANCTVSLEYFNTDSNKKTEAEGVLKAELAKLGCIIKPEGKGAGNYDRTDYAKVDNFHLKVHADVVPDGPIPNTVEAAVDFISKLPELVKRVNEGKGIPLNYVMIPTSTFKKLCKFDKIITTIIKTIDESFIIQLVYFFEELAILKQKLYDLETDFSRHQKYLPGDCLSRIRKMQQDIKTNETKLKTDLAEDLPDVRGGKLMMKDLIKKAERHKSSGLNLVRIEDFIDEFADIKSKLNNIEVCLSKNILYIGKNETLDYFTSKNTNQDFFVMYTSKELQEKNENLSKKMYNFFLSEAEVRANNNQFVIVDFDVNPKASQQVEQVVIIHYKCGRIISHDVYKDYEAENDMNFAKLANSFEMEYVQYKPNNRVPLELQCPGFRLGTCPKDPLIWTCTICKDVIEYGFNNFFYCACGKAPASFYALKCSSSSHGSKYLNVNDNFPLKEELEKLRPLKEMNILILGQSGVGKSTWINSIVNYLQYETLENAEKGGVVSVIPASFTVTYTTDERVMKQVVQVGENDVNEITQVGNSATQGPKTYHFILSDRAVRLIDTPGLGDTEGIDRDKENMKKILDHISFLKEIHGICILLKSNERRIDAIFRFCIMELLSHLHRSAARNILFCFTNSRSSFYSPGDTSVVLDKLLTDLKLDDMIVLCRKTMFCLDNEAFRFLCTLKYPNIPHTLADRSIYEGSWTKSVTETKRLFEQIKELKPHIVTDTTTLCTARNRILNLTKPIAEITQIIQLNLAAISDEERKINNSKLSLDELAKRLYMPHIELQPEPLNYPRTVCTNSKCVKHHKLKKTDATLIEYIRTCHDPCYLKDIATDAYPQIGLRKCWAMECGGSTKCRVCGCGWEHHMHITYSQKRVETSVVDADVENEINYKRNSKAKIEQHKRQLEEKIKKYEAEQRIIMKISLQFGIFLKENAIAPYNDGFKDYLKYLIQQEKNKIQKTQVDDDLLKNLNDMMQRYEAEVKILEESMKNCNDEANQRNKLTPKDIIDLEKQLYDLELTGQQMKRNVEMSVTSNAHAQRYSEQPLPVRSRYNSIFSSKQKGFGTKPEKQGALKKMLNGMMDYFAPSKVDAIDPNNLF